MPRRPGVGGASAQPTEYAASSGGIRFSHGFAALALFLHNEEPLAFELASSHALRHSEIPDEREEVEGKTKSDSPLKDSWKGRCQYVQNIPDVCDMDIPPASAASNSVTANAMASRIRTPAITPFVM